MHAQSEERDDVERADGPAEEPRDAAGTDGRPGRDAPASEAIPDPLRALYEEWFVTYNPLPLASAALVLGGLWLVARAVALRGVAGALAVAGIAELYAFALIAGAWVLRAHGHRRSAVMLGLLAALYQCDLTLHVETSVYLGVVGELATLAWLGLFALKLRLIEHALELELSRSARWIAVSGAALVASLPTLCVGLDAPHRGVAIAIGVYALGAAALSSGRSVRALEGFDVRGRRCVRGVQSLWATAVLAHVLYACVMSAANATPILAALVLVGARLAHRERTVWIVALGTLAVVMWRDPTSAPIVALLAATSLGLHAVRARQPFEVAPEPMRPRGPSYRAVPIDELRGSEITELAARPVTFAMASREARLRLGLGALSLGYLALTGRGGTLAASHSLVIDAALVLVSLALLVRLRRPSALAPLGVAAVHLALVEHVVCWPRDTLEWGIYAISLGFSMLGASIALHVRIGRRDTTGDATG